mmetsp:Transcript_15653/g.31184  ORF Transcript_15653/g.31184 Transcript_15653/m.31184 type:complete len:227 (-) Transcript_15653:32-712(-)
MTDYSKNIAQGLQHAALPSEVEEGTKKTTFYIENGDAADIIKSTTPSTSTDSDKRENTRNKKTCAEDYVDISYDSITSGSSLPVQDLEITSAEREDEEPSSLDDVIKFQQVRRLFSAGNEKSFVIRKKIISGSSNKSELEKILFEFREKDENDMTTSEEDSYIFLKVWPDGQTAEFTSFADVIKGEKLAGKDYGPAQVDLGCAIDVAKTRALFCKSATENKFHVST